MKQRVVYSRKRHVESRNPEFQFVNSWDRSYYIVEFIIDMMENLRKESEQLYSEYQYRVTLASVYMANHGIRFIDSKEEMKGIYKGRAREYTIKLFITAKQTMDITDEELIDKINSVLFESGKCDGFSYVKDRKISKASKLDMELYSEVLNGEVLISSCVLVAIHALIKESIIYGEHTS